MKNPSIIPLFPIVVSAGIDIPLANRIIELNSKENILTAQECFDKDITISNKIKNAVIEHCKFLQITPKNQLQIQYYGGPENEYSKPSKNSIFTGVFFVNLQKGVKKITLYNPYLINKNLVTHEDSKDNNLYKYEFIKSKGDFMLFDSKIKFDVDIENEMVLIFDVSIKS